MKRILLIVNLCLFLATSNYAQEKKYALYSVAFYNLENLFDTIHDAGKNDYEYLAEGQNKWNSMKYMAKLKNMSEVLGMLATDKLPMGPAVIGVSEIENRRVLEDLVKQPALADRGYNIIHYEGPDMRGIDCAFLYNPNIFNLQESKLVQNVNPNDTIHKTRGFLIASGMMANEKVHFIVNHWPSRGAASPIRELAGKQVRVLKDSLLAAFPGSKVMIMGDMNDDPMDKSMAVCLGAKQEMADVAPTELYNPWWNTLKKGMGTLMYDGRWNLFDQIVVNGSLLGNDRTSLKYFKNEIFRRDFMFQKEGRYKGNPLRTFGSGAWLNGYSDHLPVIIYLVKEIK